MKSGRIRKSERLKVEETKSRKLKKLKKSGDEERLKIP